MVMMMMMMMMMMRLLGPLAVMTYLTFYDNRTRYFSSCVIASCVTSRVSDLPTDGGFMDMMRRCKCGSKEHFNGTDDGQRIDILAIHTHSLGAF